MNRNIEISDSQNSGFRLAPITAAPMRHELEEVVVVIPVDGDIDETEHEAEQGRRELHEAGRSAPCGG